METAARTKQGIELIGKCLTIHGIHAEKSTSKYWFALEKEDADTVSEDHLKLLGGQESVEASNSYSLFRGISGPGLMSLPSSLARQALKTVLTKDCESEYSYLSIRDLTNTSAIADFFRIFGWPRRRRHQLSECHRLHPK